MEFLTDGVGNRLLEALGRATQVRIASAFFSPSSETIELLNAVKHLTLIISEEFTVNDPYKLENLNTATKLSVPPDSDDGKLHAKVFIADMPDGTVWVLIGSANLTEQGLFYNQEACIALDSTAPEDRKSITDTLHWFESLEKRAREIEIAQGKAIWKTRGRQRLTPVTKPNLAAPAYWAIKPTEGSGPNAPNHWSMFETESVIALGWEAVAVNPAIVDDEELYDAVTIAYPELTPRQAQYAVGTLRKFADLPVGALVMVSHGYSSTARDGNCVHVYAFARLTGTLGAFPFEPGVWRFRRSVEIQIVHDWINVGVLRKLLDLGSFMTTLHELHREGIEAVARELGIQIGV